MLIVAKQGQSDDSPTNSVSGLLGAVENGADIVELSARLTKDGKLVLSGAPHVNNSKNEPLIRQSTLKELRRRTAGSAQPITLLSDALDTLYGRVMLMVNIYERTAVQPLLDMLKKYIRRKTGWDNVIICSSNPLILQKIRRTEPLSHLGLIHSRHTSLAFAAWQPILQLSAVLLHRLSVSSVAVEAAHRSELPVFAYMVDRKKAAEKLEELGVDGIVTNHPEKFTA